MTVGFGDVDVTCPGHDKHEWQRPGTENRCCVNCGTVAATLMDAATAARTELFSSLRQPLSAHGQVKKR